MKRLVVPAKLENLDKAIDFILEEGKSLGFDGKKLSHIKLAAEEVIVNIISYAYPEGEGDIEINCSRRDDGALKIEIIDEGAPFDPLSLPEPDVNASLEERKICGLGIYLVRRVMDEMNYRREEGKNVLTLVKKP